MVDAVNGGTEVRRLKSGAGLRLRVPHRRALQPGQLHLRHVGHAQVGVQRGGEVERCLALVADVQRHRELPRRQVDLLAQLKLVRPGGAHFITQVVGCQLQQQAGVVLPVQAPRRVAREAVLGQRPARVELRPANRDAAADGLAFVN